MDTKDDNKAIGFQLHKITTEQFAIIQEAFDSSNPKIEMSINLNFGLDKKNQFIAAFIKVQFEQKDKPFLLIEAGNHFKIKETAWNNMQNTNNKVILPKGFACHLVMLTIGTLRGILHSKTENTEFNKFLLPTINITELIQSDVELS